MWIVKLGGSLSRDARLPRWLKMLADLGRGRVVVVPGGAAFADAVRAAQGHWGFDDLTAHNMAVLAMAQTAHMLHALEPRLVLVCDEDAILRAQHAGQAVLWMPLSLLRDAPDIITTWEVTSDSLALWLARRLNAERLVVVKACQVKRPHTLQELSAMGLVDRRFAQWAREAAFPIEVVECDDLDRVRDTLIGGASRAVPELLLPKPGASEGGRGDGGNVRSRRKPPG